MNLQWKLKTTIDREVIGTSVHCPKLAITAILVRVTADSPREFPFYDLIDEVS